MTMTKRVATIAIAGVGIATLLSYAIAEQAVKIDFSDETVGAEPKSFLSVVGVWRVEADGNNKVVYFVRNGDGVIETAQRDVTVVNADGSRLWRSACSYFRRLI